MASDTIFLGDYLNEADLMNSKLCMVLRWIWITVCFKLQKLEGWVLSFALLTSVLKLALEQKISRETKLTKVWLQKHLPTSQNVNFDLTHLICLGQFMDRIN